MLRRTTTAPSTRREGRRSPVGLPARREQQDLASAGSPHVTKSCRRVDGVARLSCVWTWTRFLLLRLLPSTLGHPLRRGQREERRFAVGLIYWRAFKFGDSLWLMDMATSYRYVSTQPTRNFDDRYRVDVGYSSATTFSTFYQMSKVRNPLYCISEWSLSLLYCMCITDTVRIAACSFVPAFCMHLCIDSAYCALVELIYVNNNCASLCLRFSCIV